MNRIKSLAIPLVVAILQVAPDLTAQQHVFDAKVPFQFSAGDKTLPAGEYRLTRRNDFLTIENLKDYSSALILSANADSSTDGQVHLLFDRVDDQCFLRKVIAPAGGLTLAMSGAEKKAQMHQRQLSSVSQSTASTTVITTGAQ